MSLLNSQEPVKRYAVVCPYCNHREYQEYKPEKTPLQDLARSIDLLETMIGRMPAAPILDISLHALQKYVRQQRILEYRTAEGVS